jgi:predicted site-specific integrase-resolvase
MELLLITPTWKRLGIHQVTLRLWADAEKVPVTRVGRERRFAAGEVTVVRVTHEDRLTRSGIQWLRRLLAAHGAALEVLHPKAPGGRGELVEDFISLMTTFAGRLYGLRPAAARRRLLAESGQCPRDSSR